MRNHTHTQPTRWTRWSVVALAAPLLLAVGCGSDDETSPDTGSPTTTSTASTTTEPVDTTADTAGFPSAEFCAAQADLASAQDGAQRNTAIGEMQAELGDDAPQEVADALDTLLTGDLDPQQYTAAEAVLSGACG